MDMLKDKIKPQKPVNHHRSLRRKCGFSPLSDQFTAKLVRLWTTKVELWSKKNKDD